MRSKQGVKSKGGFFSYEFLVEYDGVDESEFLVVEGAWQSAEFTEAETLPEFHRGFVRADGEVELYCPESHFAGDLDAVLAHLSADAFAAGFT